MDDEERLRAEALAKEEMNLAQGHGPHGENCSCDDGNQAGTISATLGQDGRVATVWIDENNNINLTIDDDANFVFEDATEYHDLVELMKFAHRRFLTKGHDDQTRG